MKRTMFAILAAAAVGFATAPASAQWGPPGGGYGGGYGGGGGYGRGSRDFDEDERPRYRRRDVDERPRYREGPAYGRGGGHSGRMGSICVTPRGNCAVGGLAPSGSSCGCPVFGARGAVN